MNCLDQDLAERRRAASAGRSSRRVAHHREPDRRAFLVRLHDHRESPERGHGDIGAWAVGRRLSSCQRGVGIPSLLEHALAHRLVHRERAREHARSRCRATGEVEQRLERSVLAGRPVERDEHHLGVAEHLGARERASPAGSSASKRRRRASSSSPAGSSRPLAASIAATSCPRLRSACAMPRPVRSEISRSEERPPISTATFIASHFPIGRREPREHALATEKLGHDRQLRTVRAPGERGAHRLEQLRSLHERRRADRLNRGFEHSPLHSASGSSARASARTASRAPAESSASAAVGSNSMIAEERRQLARQVGERGDIAARALEQRARAARAAPCAPRRAGTAAPTCADARRLAWCRWRVHPSAACPDRTPSRSCRRGRARTPRAARRATGSRDRHRGGTRAARGS